MHNLVHSALFTYTDKIGKGHSSGSYNGWKVKALSCARVRYFH